MMTGTGTGTGTAITVGPKPAPHPPTNGLPKKGLPTRGCRARRAKGLKMTGANGASGTPKAGGGKKAGLRVTCWRTCYAKVRAADREPEAAAIAVGVRRGSRRRPAPAGASSDTANTAAIARISRVMGPPSPRRNDPIIRYTGPAATGAARNRPADRVGGRRTKPARFRAGFAVYFPSPAQATGAFLRFQRRGRGGPARRSRPASPPAGRARPWVAP